MVVDERTLLVAVTSVAELLALGFELSFVPAGHRVVAVVAAQLTLFDGMVGPHMELGSLLRVAGVAKL